MASKLRNHPGIRGINVNSTMYLLSQFADDTDLYLPYDQEVLNNVFEVLADVETNTGLRVSYEKTTLYRIGSLKDSSAKLYTPRGVKWSNEFVNTLGIDISTDEKIVKRNLNDTIAKMKAVSSMWYYRSMTILGKITIINSLTH